MEVQTLTFTSGALGIAPANHGSILLSDSRHGNYFMNKARSLIFAEFVSPGVLTHYGEKKNSWPSGN
jgi:7-keto-8-aminopelargonate synthetase-like enzyme